MRFQRGPQLKGVELTAPCFSQSHLVTGVLCSVHVLPEQLFLQCLSPGKIGVCQTVLTQLSVSVAAVVEGCG